ncbi:PSP1-domain-containing protein [Clavulina sp. PMI_390]|nr:PSP1-domain-containing protein [Clavulina sp. PMI_390]
MGLSSPASVAAPNVADPDVQLGKGTPLYAVPRDAPLDTVGFKAKRNDIFYVADPEARGELRVGELVIVEADRGRDLGRVTHGNISTADVEAWQRSQAEPTAIAARHGHPVNSGSGGVSGGEDEAVVRGKIGMKELMPKRIYARTSAEDTRLLQTKQGDEMDALQLCQSKFWRKKLPMEVVDAEYQWDRRKLTFYFIADRRIDFRELVRELFRIYKTRIWMSSLQGPMASE